jgi:cyclic pyranopterin phosphate synthase
LPRLLEPTLARTAVLAYACQVPVSDAAQPSRSEPVRDTFARPLHSLRLSVTDRCNLRCTYCMPEPDYVWLPKAELLTFEELDRVTGIFCSLGVDKVRLTGGEPLLRSELPTLVRHLAARPAVRDLAMTTNGVLLADLARPLRQAGLRRLTVSLDTLRPERFRAMTRTDFHGRVLAGIEGARAEGFPLKLDAVILRGINDDEVLDLLSFGREIGAEVRFIEYMDVGGATGWTREQVVSRAELLERIAAGHGRAVPLGAQGSDPAQRFRLPEGTVFGVIASTTTPFCRACDRSRLTADGTWYTCLYAKKGANLRAAIRAGASDAEIASLLRVGWRARTDRGAEERLHLEQRGALAERPELRQDPHLEMHTRGG